MTPTTNKMTPTTNNCSNALRAIALATKAGHHHNNNNNNIQQSQLPLANPAIVPIPSWITLSLPQRHMCFANDHICPLFSHRSAFFLRASFHPFIHSLVPLFYYRAHSFTQTHPSTQLVITFTTPLLHSQQHQRITR